VSQNILDVYDSEVKQLLEFQAALTERARSGPLNYAAFEREMRDKAAELGFTIDVNWYRYSIDGAEQDGAMPEITVTGRTDTAFRFDPDRQVHEAVHNVLDLPGETGWIKTDPDTVKNFLDGQGGHGHDHGHHSH
jgi:hypothetical protein